MNIRTTKVAMRTFSTPGRCMNRTEQALRELFRKHIENRQYRYWAALVLYAAQTEDERVERLTRWRNFAGFSAGDVAILTDIAEKLQRGARLFAKEERELQRRLPKYWRQFTRTTLVELPGKRAGKTSPAKSNERRAA